MRIFFQSFGCAKNSVDSEKLIGLLNAAGHEIVFVLQENVLNQAEIAIINTCGFIEDAVKENINAILDLENLKGKGVIKKIIVAGCIYNRYGEALQKEIPAVDLWVKSEDWYTVLRFLGGNEKIKMSNEYFKRGILKGNLAASRYLKISEGCDSFCSYCTIPSIRGRARSLPIEQIVAEAINLCECGAKELCLVGQDTTLYGVDKYGEPKFEELLEELEKNTPDDIWIRLLYLHPNRVTRKFIDKVTMSKKILSYLDIPIQHISVDILQSMNRSGDEPHIRDIFSYARRNDPLFALRTTLMVGFPGETDEHFKNLLGFLEEAQIDRVGVFEYSPEEGTKAASFANQVNKRTKKSRASRLMKLQSKISTVRQRLFIGNTLKILVESIDTIDKIAWGRSYRDAPEVDGLVGTCFSLESKRSVKTGEFIHSKISDSTEHDLFGELAQR
jgi:ribosomal protein S12 methylthiotransferase